MQYEAVYNGDVASYRQTVLSAFQQVEDSLAAVRILSQQIQQQEQAQSRRSRWSIWRRLATRQGSIPIST